MTGFSISEWSPLQAITLITFRIGKKSLAKAESDGVALSFQYGKRLIMTDTRHIRPDEAQNALDSVDKMQSAGFRRARPPRWYGAGISLIVAVGFALYALEDPGSLPGLFIALGIAIFAGISRQKIGAFGRQFPDTKVGIWALVGICAFMITLFFGGIYVRRAYDLAWVPLLTGLIAGLSIFLLSESERRYYIARGEEFTQR